MKFQPNSLFWPLHNRPLLLNATGPPRPPVNSHMVSFVFRAIWLLWHSSGNGKIRRRTLETLLEGDSPVMGTWWRLIKCYVCAINQLAAPASKPLSEAVHRGPVAQLSLSCKSAAVQNMTATALAGPLRGVEHFQGSHLKNDNLRHWWDINYG